MKSEQEIKKELLLAESVLHILSLDGEDSEAKTKAIASIKILKWVLGDNWRG